MREPWVFLESPLEAPSPAVLGVRAALTTSAGAWRSEQAVHFGPRVAGAVGAEGQRCLEGRWGPLRYRWEWTLRPEGLVSRLTLRHEGSEPLRLSRVCLAELDAGEGGELRLAAPAAEWAFYQHGWMSWAPTLVRAARGPDRFVWPTDDADYAPHIQPIAPDRLGGCVSSDVTLVGSADAGLAVGLLEPERALNGLTLALDAEGRFARFAVELDLDEVPLAPGESWESPRLWWAWGEPERLLDTYGRLTAPRGFAVPAPVGGWCTWYHYFGTNGRAELQANLEALAREGAVGAAIEWMLLDDGHQRAIGDWLDTDGARYPLGMAEAASAIAQTGRRAGLWLAPFCVGANSRLCAAHPEWLVQRRDGGGPVVVQHHWGTDIHALDLTRQDVLAHLKALVRVLTREWGYGVLKLDFLHFAACEGARADERLNRLEAYRQGLAAIREAAGPGVHLLGCGAPLAASRGLVDSMRVGQDVGVGWESATPRNMSSVSTYHACMNVVHRAWQQGRWWRSDPDCAIVRGPGLVHPGTEAVRMSPDERRFLAVVLALSGGHVLDSDDLSGLGPAAWRELGFLLPPDAEAARWLGGFSPAFPARLVRAAANAFERWQLLGGLNWGAQARTLSWAEVLVPLVTGAPSGALTVFDAWAGRGLSEAEWRAGMALEGHAAALWAVRPARAHPWWGGDDRHWGQGLAGVERCEWQADERTLMLVLTPLPVRRGTVWLSCPTPYVLAAASGLEAGEKAEAEGGWVKLALDVAAPRRLSLRFEEA